MSVSALDKLIASTSNHWPTLTPKARAELAQLRADLKAAQERSAEQARQLESARNLIIRSGRVINNLKKPDSVYDLTNDLLDWLAANPAPQEQTA